MFNIWPVMIHGEARGNEENRGWKEEKAVNKKRI
jgi:hypothetical protein